MDALTLLKQDEKKDILRFVTAGSVDDGKSTMIGTSTFHRNASPAPKPITAKPTAE